MSMTSILRIEDREGFGPFRTDRIVRAMARAALGEERPFHVGPEFPPPSGDPSLRMFWQPGLHRSGTATAQELDHWFPEPVRHVLSGADYRVAVYEVPEEDAILGETQAIFDPKRARLVRSIPVTEFHP